MQLYGVRNHLLLLATVLTCFCVPTSADGRSIEPEVDSAFGVAGAVALPARFSYNEAPLVLASGRTLYRVTKDGSTPGFIAVSATGSVEATFGDDGFLRLSDDCHAEVELVAEFQGDPIVVCYWEFDGFHDIVTYRIAPTGAREVQRLAADSWRTSLIPDAIHGHVHGLIDESGVTRLVLTVQGARFLVATIPVGSDGTLGSMRSLELPDTGAIRIDRRTSLTMVHRDSQRGDAFQTVTVRGLATGADGAPRVTWQAGPATVPNPPGDDAITPGGPEQMIDGSAMRPLVFGNSTIRPTTLARAGGRIGQVAFITNGVSEARMVDLRPTLAPGADQGQFFDVRGFGDRFTMRWSSRHRDGGLFSSTMHLRTSALSGDMIDEGAYQIDFLDRDRSGHDLRGRSYRIVDVGGIPPLSHTFVTRSCADDARCRGIRGGRVASGTRRRDALVGTFMRDRLIGLGGADLLVGGLGRDSLQAGEGNDVVRARDFTVDQIDCGPGRDTAIVDRSDVTRNCEIVQRA